MPQPIKITRTTIPIELSEKTPILVEYTYCEGKPARPMTSGSPGEPACPAEINILAVYLDLPSDKYLPKRVNLLHFLTEDSLSDLRATLEEEQHDDPCR